MTGGDGSVKVRLQRNTVRKDRVLPQNVNLLCISFVNLKGKPRGEWQSNVCSPTGQL